MPKEVALSHPFSTSHFHSQTNMKFTVHHSPNSLLLFSIFTLLYLRLISATCHVDDETGLLGFKSGITQDPSGMLSSWKPGTNCCKWAGVTCRKNNRVEILTLIKQYDNPNSFLTGTISPSLKKVRNLRGLYLLGLRNLSGRFPDLVFGLPQLQVLYIEDNKLSGQIPRTIGNLTRLILLGLSGNRFTGPIPSSISKLTQLSQLNFGNNLLTGTIPEGIRNLKNLTDLRLDRNALSGSIPDSLSTLPELRILSLSQNKLSGKIPSTIANLSRKLAYLELGHNSLIGQIPDFLGNFKALETLNLSSNHLSGVVPKSFRNLTKILNLDLSRNFLVDPFPVMNVKNIISLDLSYNQFHLKEIPKWAMSSIGITSLKLAKCGIKMNLDSWRLSNWTYYSGFDYIDLSENEISGSPIKLLNRTESLVGFWGSGNNFRFDLERLSIVETLKYLDLSRNRVFGKVPKAISGLEKLNVSYNHLCGQLPATKFGASAFVGNDCLCGSPLAPCK